jgi:Family of unknown function (DUF6496)
MHSNAPGGEILQKGSLLVGEHNESPQEKACSALHRKQNARLSRDVAEKVVKNRKQAITIGLSETCKKGANGLAITMKKIPMPTVRGIRNYYNGNGV